jgi:site-specific recombinase XerD
MTFKNIIWKYEKKADDTCAVKIYVCINRKVKYYPVKGIYVEEKYWNAKKGLVKSKHPLYQTYNNLIRRKRLEIEEYFLNGGSFEGYKHGVNNTQSDDLISLFEKYIDRVEKGEVKQSSGTLSNYKSTLSKVKQYIEYTGKNLTVNDIDAAFQEKFIAFLRAQQVSLATIGLHFTRIKLIISRTASNHNNTYYKKLPGFRKHQGSKKQIYLTLEEIKLIENVQLDPALDKHRDRFLICYYFLIRISDSFRISKSSIIQSEGKSYLFIHSKKTNKEQIVPVSKKAKNLLEKHNYTFKNVANSTANKAVRQIGEIAGIRAPIQVGNKTVPKYQLMNTHTARRSGATNLRLQGASLKTIADLGGWSDMKILESYLKASGLDSAKMARDFDHFK